VTCRVPGFSRQAFYAWKHNPVSRRDWDDAHLINAAIDIHAGDPAFGYRFITGELAAAGMFSGGEDQCKWGVPANRPGRRMIKFSPSPGPGVAHVAGPHGPGF
jgi:hypothetical protein